MEFSYEPIILLCLAYCILEQNIWKPISLNTEFNTALVRKFMHNYFTIILVIL